MTTMKFVNMLGTPIASHRLGLESFYHTQRTQVTRFLLLQSLAKLTDGFRNSFSLSDPLQDFPHNPGVPGDSLPQQFCDAGSQTDIIGEVRQERGYKPRMAG